MKSQQTREMPNSSLVRTGSSRPDRLGVRQPAGSRRDEQDGPDGEERAQVEAARHLAHPVHPVQHAEVATSSRTRARMRRSEARMKPGVRLGRTEIICPDMRYDL